jgi:hypothetical protein
MNLTKEKHAHTPGPWVVGSNVTAGNKLEGCSIFAEKIKDQIGWMRFDLDEENHANARLIAAAPAMYQLLVRVSQFNGYDSLSLAMDAREVLAKLEGGEG